MFAHKNGWIDKFNIFFQYKDKHIQYYYCTYVDKYIQYYIQYYSSMLRSLMIYERNYNYAWSFGVRYWINVCYIWNRLRSAFGQYALNFCLRALIRMSRIDDSIACIGTSADIRTCLEIQLWQNILFSLPKINISCNLSANACKKLLVFTSYKRNYIQGWNNKKFILQWENE